MNRKVRSADISPFLNISTHVTLPLCRLGWPGIQSVQPQAEPSSHSYCCPSTPTHTHHHTHTPTHPHTPTHTHTHTHTTESRAPQAGQLGGDEVKGQSRN